MGRIGVVRFCREVTRALPRLSVRRNRVWYWLPSCWGIEVARPLSTWLLSAWGRTLVLRPSRTTMDAVDELKNCCAYWHETGR